MRKVISLSLLTAAALSLAGCAGSTSRVPPIEVWPDMDRQGKGKPQMESDFFGDHRASRLPVEGTVARGFLKEDEAYATGIANNQYIGKNPEALTPELLKRGQARFNIYCSPCHDKTGHGQGIVGARSLWIASNLHEDRVRTLVDGEIFNVITYGRRSMPSYRFQIPEHDRWAIVSYVRALQRTDAKLEDVPQELRTQLR